MDIWPDWRYRMVDAIDKVWHVFAGTHETPLCNLERRMWWRRYDVMYPETAFRRAT